MRLFVSIDLPAHLTEAIADLQALFDAASGLRFTDPEQAHLTLKFLGECSGARRHALTDAIEDAVSDADVGPFTARFGGLGVFPNLEYIRVLWLGIELGGEQLTALHAALESRTTAMGFEPESHTFTPHVTLARMEHAGGKDLVQTLVRNRDPTVGEMHVAALSLTKSTLTADGPVYETLERFPLA